MKKSENFSIKLQSLKTRWGGGAKIFIIPTATGFAVLASVIFCLLGGAIYSNNLLYLMSFVLMTLFALVMLMTHQNLRRLRIREIQIHSGFAGGKVPLWISFENLSVDDRQYIDLGVKINSQKWPSSVEKSFRIPGKQVYSKTFYVQVKERGAYRLRGISISTRYPFGLFHAWISARESQEFFVFPQPVGSLPLPLGPNIGNEGRGVMTFSNPEEFFDLKTYRDGETLHSIHWASYARHRQLQSKLMGQTGSRQVDIQYQILNLSDLESRLSQLSRWLLEAKQQGLVLSLAGFKEQVLYSRNDHEYTELMKQLALYREVS